MSYRYKAIIANALQQEQALRCNNRHVDYIVMNDETRDFLRETLGMLIKHVGVCSIFGYKILIDPELKDNEVKVVGGL